jgi:hypothetical protein
MTGEKIMKIVVTAIFALGLLSMAACTSSKELNEKSAHALIKDQYAKVHFPIAVSIVGPLMTRVPVSYGSLVDTLKTKEVKENVAVYIVKRLLDAKLVTETVDTVKYPNIRGKFRAGPESYCQYCFDEYELEMVPNTNHLKGVRTRQRQNETVGHFDATGVVEANGLVSLGRDRFQYKEDGPTAWLMDQDTSNITNYKGTASSSTVEAKWYTYAFSPELKAEIEKTQMPTFGGFGTTTEDTLNGGSYEIGDVSDLQLGITPTMASASFAWTVSLNKIGKLFYQADTPTGKGRVNFVRKPDETWIIKDWCIANCAF